MSSYRSAGSHTRNQERSTGGRTRPTNRNHRDQVARLNTFDTVVVWRRIDDLTLCARNARYSPCGGTSNPRAPSSTLLLIVHRTCRHEQQP